jgi:hypothetical protein
LVGVVLLEVGLRFLFVVVFDNVCPGSVRKLTGAREELLEVGVCAAAAAAVAG